MNLGKFTLSEVADLQITTLLKTDYIADFLSPAKNEHILSKCSISILPEKVSKPEVL